jgi:catechol-2,3-dioxygenase
MNSFNSVKLGHVGLFVRDLEAMAGFYQRVFQFIVTDVDVGVDGKRRALFFSSNPQDHHQLVLVSGRATEPGPPIIQQISFATTSLADVRRAYYALQQEQISHIKPITHGTAWSVYFHDPENNRIEIFADTEWYITQPFVSPIDFNDSDAAIFAQTEALCRAQPSFMLMSQWRKETAERLRRQDANL